METSKIFLINIRTIFLFNFRVKNASFSLLTVMSFSGWVMLYAFKYLSKVTEEESTFCARVGPISVKYLLKFSAIDFFFYNIDLHFANKRLHKYT